MQDGLDLSLLQFLFLFEAYQKYFVNWPLTKLKRHHFSRSHPASSKCKKDTFFIFCYMKAQSYQKGQPHAFTGPGWWEFQSSQPLPPHNSLLHDCSLPNLSKVAYMALWKTVGNSWNEMPSCPLTFLLFTVPVYGHNHADTAKQVTNKPFSSLLTLLAKIYLSVPVFSILGKSPTCCLL